MDNIVVIFEMNERKKLVDLEIPLDITANELIMALNSTFELGMNDTDISRWYLKTENPIAFLKGDKTLREFNLRNGTVIKAL